MKVKHWKCLFQEHLNLYFDNDIRLNYKISRQYYHFLSAYIRQFTFKIAFQRCTITYPLFSFPLQTPFCVTFVITSISFTSLLPKKSELKRQYQNLVSSHFHAACPFFPLFSHVISLLSRKRNHQNQMPLAYSSRKSKGNHKENKVEKGK
jgi:hypothetical protein